MASNFELSNNPAGKFDASTADLETKYWTYRIIALALADIAYTEPSHPKVSQATIEQIRNLLHRIEFETGHNHVKSSSRKPDGEIEDGKSVPIASEVSHKNIELSSESQLIVKALISLGVQKLGNNVLKLWNIERNSLTEKIQETPAANAEEHVVKVVFNKLATRLKEVKIEEEILDRDIEETEYIRMKEMLAYDKELSEVKEMMTELMGETLLKKKPQIMTSYIDHLKSQSELITSKIQCAKLQQQIDEHPIEVVDEFEKAFNELKSTVASKEKECLELKGRLAKYESLGPELLEIAMEYQSIEENIKTKEWVLQQLASSSGDQSFDTSLF